MPPETAKNRDNQKRAKVPQTEFPNVPLESALRLPQALWENFAGKAATPMNLAMALDMKPSSGGWRNLCGSGIAYGLTEGGYNAAEISLTQLGLRIVRPTVEGDDLSAKCEALLKPRIQREFLQRYNKAKFPKDTIAQNILIEMGLPKERAMQALEILKKNGAFAKAIIEIKGDIYVSLDQTSATFLGGESEDDHRHSDLIDFNETERNISESSAIESETQTKPELVVAQSEAVRRVFVTHGKNIKILDQIKKIVTYGGFEAVVAKDNETAAKPVPDKVLSDMRTCQAAVIHVGSEGTFKDEDDNLHPRLNGNVLIEIGIARALYDYNFILLVEEGLSLPSNLQGLYECRYQGGELNMEATMKILESFNEFKKSGVLIK